MTDSTNPPAPAVRTRWLRWAVRLLIALLVLIAVPLAFEATRWSALPTEPLPVTESGPAVGGAAGVEARSAISDWLAARQVTGLAACVGVEGEVLWCSASGYANVPERRPLQPTTSMRIGSVSKTVSAILLARLDEQGAVDLDRPIGEISLKGRPHKKGQETVLPEHLSSITLRQLASHTSGIRHYGWRFAWPPHETWSRRPYESVSDSLQQFTSDELLFAPGTDFQYSTNGYTLLGAAMEEATGRSYRDLLHGEIIEPHGLSSTGLEKGELGDQSKALPYETMGSRYRNALRVDNSRCWPGGGIWSSAQDLARLVSGLPNGSTVQTATLERYLEPQTLADGSDNPQRYALGWRIGRTSQFLGGSESYRVAHHGGVSSGGSAFLVLFPDQSVAVAVITNTRTGSSALIDLAFDVAEPFMADVVEAAAADGAGSRVGPP